MEDCQVLCDIHHSTNAQFDRGAEEQENEGAPSDATQLLYDIDGDWMCDFGSYISGQ